MYVHIILYVIHTGTVMYPDWLLGRVARAQPLLSLFALILCGDAGGRRPRPRTQARSKRSTGDL